MDLLDAIKKRRSVRSYKKDPVPRNLLLELVEAGRWAPTGGNRQYWKFIIVDDPKVMEMVKLVSPMMWGVSPVAIVVCQDLTRRELGEEIKGGYGECAGFPSQNILLAAHSRGLGSCAIGGFNKEALKEVLNIPETMWPMLVITVGYPGEEPEPKTRRPLSETVFLNSCKNPWRDEDEL
jgi:nitroreductase